MKTTGHNTFTAMVLTAAIAVLLTLSGCTDSSGYKEPEFPSERQLRFEILGEPLTTRDFGDIFTYGDYIIVCGHDSVSGNTFHVFDKASGLKVMESIQFGGDPGRTYMGYTMATLHDGVMSYIDPLDKKETVFNMEGMLSPEIREVDLGTAEVREVFRVPKIGLVAGCYILEGKVTRNAYVKVIRDSIQINKENIKMMSLKRFKDDVKEVTAGYECGIGLENFQDLQKGDILEFVQMQEIARKLDIPE